MKLSIKLNNVLSKGFDDDVNYFQNIFIDEDDDDVLMTRLMF